MAGWEQTVILGFVGRSPELRYTQSGVAVCSFSVAVTSSWTKDGEKQSKTNWYSVSCWRQLAEVCNQYVHKGMQVMVVGTVEARGYTNNNGEPSASLELTARDIQFLGNRADSGDNQGDEPPQNKNSIPF